MHKTNHNLTEPIATPGRAVFLVEIETGYYKYNAFSSGQFVIRSQDYWPRDRFAIYPEGQLAKIL